MTGSRSSVASSKVRVTFSPTTAPMEPPMKAKSRTQMATGLPSTVPVPATAASGSPDLRAAFRSFSG